MLSQLCRDIINTYTLIVVTTVGIHSQRHIHNLPTLAREQRSGEQCTGLLPRQDPRAVPHSCPSTPPREPSPWRWRQHRIRHPSHLQTFAAPSHPRHGVPVTMRLAGDSEPDMPSHASGGTPQWTCQLRHASSDGVPACRGREGVPSDQFGIGSPPVFPREHPPLSPAAAAEFPLLP
ncbi:hypothetical protein C2E23DRAFT_51092 [Lenzites betulinus]|nr:hypothetical protein C2E23DRAFT_51092 [Lenzites betulinus]